jgi:peptidoglycan/LPS O-acetylase OafA/YrhL
MFLLGMLLRRVVVEDSGEARKWALLLVPLSAAVGVVMGGAFCVVPANGNVYFPPLALSTAMALPVLVFVAVLWWRPAPSKAVMYLGTVSYSLYLFQDIGLHLLPFAIPPGHWPILYVVAVMAVSLGVAAMVNQWLEKPAIELGRKLGRARGQAVSTGVPA